MSPLSGTGWGEHSRTEKWKVNSVIVQWFCVLGTRAHVHETTSVLSKFTKWNRDFLEYFVSLTKTVRNARCHYYTYIFFLPWQFGRDRGLQLPSSPQREDEGPFSWKPLLHVTEHVVPDWTWDWSLQRFDNFPLLGARQLLVGQVIPTEKKVKEGNYQHTLIFSVRLSNSPLALSDIT